MANSQQLQTAIQMFGSFLEKGKSARTIDESRGAYEEFMSQFQLDEDIWRERVGAGGVPAEWIAAPGAADDRVILYLHGGGYVLGSMRTHRVMLSRISRASGVRVLGIEYRLAPENPFPAAVEDTVAAYRWLLSQGVDASRIVIGGDSAGGGLTVASLVALRYLGEPMAAAGFCISGWIDLSNSGESIITKAEEDPIARREMLDDLAKIYMGDRDPRTPLASPVYADLQGCRRCSSRWVPQRFYWMTQPALPSAPRRLALMWSLRSGMT